MCAVLAAGAAGVGLARWSHQKADGAATATVHVVSSPAGATVEVDGRSRGHTPLVLRVPPGEHRVALRAAGFAPLDATVHLSDSQSLDVQRELWLASPTVDLLRSPLPGAPVSGVDFLQDGRLVYTVQLPGGQQQLWVSETTASQSRPLTPVAAERLVASGDGAHIAYLTRTKTDAALDRLNEVWTTAGGDQPRRVFALPTGDQADRLSDLAWLPDGRSLLVAVQRSLMAGGSETQLLLLNAVDQSTRALITLPAEPVAGSYSWRPDGGAVAFLARAGGLVSLVTLTVPAGQIRYLTDLEQTDGAPLPFAPVAWGPHGELAFSAPPQQQPGQQVWLPMSRPDPLLFHLGSMDAPASTPGGVRATSPAWRSDGSLVAFTRPKRDGSLALAALNSSGSADSLTPIGIKPSAFVARWDVAHGQAVIAAHDQANGADRLAYWVVRFREQQP
jgi:hypothetical protein